MLPFQLPQSDCRNGRRYRNDFYAIDSPIYVSPRSCKKFRLHRSTASSLSFAPKWPTHPCWLERRIHSMHANCGRMIRDIGSAMRCDKSESSSWYILSIWASYSLKSLKSPFCTFFCTFNNLDIAIRWRVRIKISPKSPQSAQISNTSLPHAIYYIL